MANSTNSAPVARLRSIAYWVTTALVVFELAVGGAWDVLRVPQVLGLIDRSGYPHYFLVILGIWKLLGAVALAIPRFPRLKEWAYAGVFFDLTGAVASLCASGFIDTGTIAYPLLISLLPLYLGRPARHRDVSPKMQSADSKPQPRNPRLRESLPERPESTRALTHRASRFVTRCEIFATAWS